MSEFGIVRSNDKQEGSFFHIDEYSFFRDYKIGISKKTLDHNISIILKKDKKNMYGDLVNILKDIDQSPIYTIVDPDNNVDEKDVYIKWLTDIPKEEYEYIKKYESEVLESQSILFHDFKKKYIEICKCQDSSLDCGIVFIGYTLINNRFEIKIRTFNYKVIEKISYKIIEKFHKNGYVVKSTNLNWTRIDNFVVGENDNFNCDESEKLLKNTLKQNWDELFQYLFNKFDKEGYINLNIIEGKDTDKEKDIKKQISRAKQIHGLLKPYLKLFINNHFMYLHDQASLDLKDEKNNRIYCFSPRLLQYYQKQWFEDFIGEVLNVVKKDCKSFVINSSKANFIFNFYKDNQPSNNIEIDWLIDVEKDGISRTIGIECKKTLKKVYYEETKNKVVTKIINSGKAVIDGYIVVGYFKEPDFDRVLNLDKVGEYTPDNLLNENAYSEENIFIQYMAISGTSVSVLSKKIIECINVVFKNSI